MTYNDCLDILKEAKQVVDDDGTPKSKYRLNFQYPVRTRIKLISQEKSKSLFILDVKQSDKVQIKVSLNYFHCGINDCIFRVDFNGSHNNPIDISNNVPDVFRNYVGCRFDYESHIHYYVEGYALRWALPLKVVKDLQLVDLKDNSNIQSDLSEVLKSLFAYLNVETNIIIDLPLL